MHENYDIIQTADGSPSLRLQGAWQDTESMHNLNGAWSETNYIYGHAMRTFLQNTSSSEPHLMSVGLGLGYVEMLFAKQLQQFQVANGQLTTFESSSFLQNSFLHWLGFADENSSNSSNFSVLYEQVLQITASEEMQAIALKQFLQNMYANHQAKFVGTLNQHTQFKNQFNVVCYDPFSARTNPDLWTYDFLENFIRTAAAPSAVFATYACTSILKKALKANGFTVEKRAGFAGKRESTFAYRL